MMKAFTGATTADFHTYMADFHIKTKSAGVNRLVSSMATFILEDIVFDKMTAVEMVRAFLLPIVGRN